MTDRLREHVPNRVVVLKGTQDQDFTERREGQSFSGGPTVDANDELPGVAGIRLQSARSMRARLPSRIHSSAVSLPPVSDSDRWSQ